MSEIAAVTDALAEASAKLVALTVCVPGCVPGVNSPSAVMVPVVELPPVLRSTAGDHEASVVYGCPREIEKTVLPVFDKMLYSLELDVQGGPR